MIKFERGGGFFFLGRKPYLGAMITIRTITIVAGGKETRDGLERDARGDNKSLSWQITAKV